jgi:predicted DCC family thiol-disulfide oxidoreductase YuxK
VVVFDGDCNFCRLWIRRWQAVTMELVDYEPLQSPRLAARFTEVPASDLEKAVHLIDTDGSVYSGAEAAFRALAHAPHEHWLLDWYAHSTTFARISERVYGFTATHRRSFSFFTRLFWGAHVEPPRHILLRSVFLRLLGLIYLIAFASLWVQILGLLGSNGIVPAKATIAAAAQQAAAAHMGTERYHLIPTLCWFNAGDSFLQIQCLAGVISGICLIIGVAPALCLALLWMLYLSLATIGQEFLGFQWDNLLLETGLLATFFAPLRLWGFSKGAPPSRIVLWLFRLLLFKLMFQSGCVKLFSGDATWRNLSALNYHFETQPLPTWVGYYAYFLPHSVLRICTALMFGIELVVPFLVFAPRRVRQVPCMLFILLQALIVLTGNYCFFNLLTMLLCLLLLDDAALEKLSPTTWHKNPLFNSAVSGEAVETRASSPVGQRKVSGRLRWPIQITFPLACITLVVSLIQFAGMFRVRIPWPGPFVTVYRWVAPLRSFNNYGLFAIMTTSRPEIIAEGSEDGIRWMAYEFKYKPGDMMRRPGFVEPHQPRLDWQMWFAALGSYRENPWFINFCIRLLQGSPQVLELLERNPFPVHPPRYVRARVYDYRFASWAEHKKTGAWWQREFKGEYVPALSLQKGEGSESWHAGARATVGSGEAAGLQLSRRD